MELSPGIFSICSHHLSVPPGEITIATASPLKPNISFFISSQEEELDYLTMNFISYGGKRISAVLVWGFLCWQSIGHKDTLLLHVS